MPRPAWLLAFAVAAALAAWAVFAHLPPMPVRVGRAAIDAVVPLGYQLSVFPAFGAFAGAVLLDALRGDDRPTLLPRAALVVVTSLLALGRLGGALPLSGHTLFLFAVLGYELAPPTDRDAPLSLALVIPALLVVGWSKLVVWSDPAWFGASALAGLVLGAALARAARS
ncbi:MAG TPA: hypothetical protein VGG39_23990 [Polyangiaceae bacterium]